MKLIIGGAFQGKLAFAKKQYEAAEGWIDGRSCELSEIETCRGIYHLEEYVKRLLDGGKGNEDAAAFEPGSPATLARRAEAFVENLYRRNPGILLISNEVGCGIVPLAREERIWREAAGRICTAAAARSDEVVRVICGCGQWLKTAPEETKTENSEITRGRTLFPVYIDITDAPVLVAGAGEIAARRIRTLLGFARDITVVAPEILPELEELAQSRSGASLKLHRRPFAPADLKGKKLALAATNDAALNAEIAVLCRAQRIPVNVCSDQSLCDFQFPSVVQDGDVVIGINASGRNHRLVKETRKKLERCLLGSGSLYKD